MRSYTSRFLLKASRLKVMARMRNRKKETTYALKLTRNLEFIRIIKKKQIDIYDQFSEVDLV